MLFLEVFYVFGLLALFALLQSSFETILGILCFFLGASAANPRDGNKAIGIYQDSSLLLER